MCVTTPSYCRLRPSTVIDSSAVFTSIAGQGLFSDSDDDMFTPTASKPAAAVLTRPPTQPPAVTAVTDKRKSVFSDSDSEDDLFGGGGAKKIVKSTTGAPVQSSQPVTQPVNVKYEEKTSAAAAPSKALFGKI